MLQAVVHFCCFRYRTDKAAVLIDLKTFMKLDLISSHLHLPFDRLITTSHRRAIGHYEANYMHVSPRNKIDEGG